MWQSTKMKSADYFLFVKFHISKFVLLLIKNSFIMSLYERYMTENFHEIDITSMEVIRNN